MLTTMSCMDEDGSRKWTRMGRGRGMVISRGSGRGWGEGEGGVLYSKSE